MSRLNSLGFSLTLRTSRDRVLGAITMEQLFQPLPCLLSIEPLCHQFLHHYKSTSQFNGCNKLEKEVRQCKRQVNRPQGQIDIL